MESESERYLLNTNDFVLAAYSGDLQTIQSFISRNPNCINDRHSVWKKTALIYASQSGNIDIVKLLLENKAELNAQDPETGFTPLIYAVVNNHIEIVELLISSGADISIRDKDGKTAQDSTDNNVISGVLMKVDSFLSSIIYSFIYYTCRQPKFN